MSTTNLYTPVKDIPKIYDQLKESFERGVTKDVNKRLEQIVNIKRMLNERESDLVDALVKDGKCRAEAITEADLVTTSKECVLFEKQLRNWLLPEKKSLEFAFTASLDSAELVREPLGTVLIIGTWNYPISTVIVPLIGALAAGNTAVVKLSEVAENTGALLHRLLKNYVSTDFCKTVYGAVNETTALLKLKWDHIFYTGNGTVGRIIAKAAAEHLTPVTLELGGKSPVFIDETVDLSFACRRIVYGKFINNGQTCIAPDYVLLPSKLQTEFVNKIKEILSQFYGDSPVSECQDYGRIVNARHWQRLDGYLKKTKGEIEIGGDRDLKSLFFAPTVVSGVQANDSLMGEELFGPILPIVQCESMDEAIKFIRSRDKPLAAYLFSNDRQSIDRFKSEVYAGGMVINDVVTHFASSSLPFGGVGESGIGNYHGEYSLKTFSHQKPVLWRSVVGEIASPFLLYPPYSETKSSWTKWLLLG